MARERGEMLHHVFRTASKLHDDERFVEFMEEGREKLIIFSMKGFCRGGLLVAVIL